MSGHNTTTHGLSRRGSSTRSAYQREFNLLAKYGLTIEAYEKMVTQQGGCCLLCDKKPKEKLVVDHCHVSGKVRGLLCIRCNLNLAPIEDPFFFPRAVAYLSTGRMASGKQKED